MPKVVEENPVVDAFVWRGSLRADGVPQWAIDAVIDGKAHVHTAKEIDRYAPCGGGYQALGDDWVLLYKDGTIRAFRETDFDSLFEVVKPDSAEPVPETGPCINVKTANSFLRVYPAKMLRRVADGELELTDIEDWESIMLAVIADWLEMLTTLEGTATPNKEA